MKKILYFLMMALSIVGILALLFLPFYKFEKDKIVQYNTDYYATLVNADCATYRNKENYNSLSEKDQKGFKAEYKAFNIVTYAVMNDDEEIYYEQQKIAIVDKMYREKHPDVINLADLCTRDSEGHLVTSDEAIASAEKTVKVDMGEAFDEQKSLTVKAEMATLKASIYTEIKTNYGVLTDEQAEEMIAREGVSAICNNLFYMYYDCVSDLGTLDVGMVEDIIDGVLENGLKATTFISSWKGIIESYKALWNSESYSSLSGLKKINAIRKDPKFYNPLALVILSAIFVVLLFNLVLFFFKGIKGVIGKKYPSTFLKSIIDCAICAFLVFAIKIVELKFLFEYHDVEFTRFMQLFFFGSYSTSMYICMAIFGLFVIISIIGRFTKWGDDKK